MWFSCFKLLNIIPELNNNTHISIMSKINEARAKKHNAPAAEGHSTNGSSYLKLMKTIYEWKQAYHKYENTKRR